MKKNQGSGGVDGVSMAMFEKSVSLNLRELQRLLQQGRRYKPAPVRRHFIEKENGKLRPLGIRTIRDRVCQQAVRQIIEPIFEQDSTTTASAFVRDTRRTKQSIRFDVQNAAESADAYSRVADGGIHGR